MQESIAGDGVTDDRPMIQRNIDNQAKKQSQDEIAEDDEDSEDDVA